ncbi:PEP-CTERM sorting domain-containing protein [Mucisphaera calidilacus]|uniref:PEP-CTERM protein-sorting domain-containing protein n=1 Tax=Mucisphaera calidilacus TaxID=2527982 RepID=A0A518BZW7_9BACT|nr:PEP-CTERM sorting domain-containing protein [Mucisphaera calidilacus]QDU72512.1 hypothetical protein Pan265_23810 [Mucisphaera calidilacus]
MTRHESTDHRLLAYSLAAGAAALGVSDASAGIVYSGPQDIEVFQFGGQQLNLDGDAYDDILLKNYVFGGGNYQGLYVNFYPGKVNGFISGFAYASALSAGDPINAGTVSVFQASMAYGTNNPNAEFNNADGAFIGIGFPIAGVNHFGWIRVTIDNAAGRFIINDWAYEDQPGVGIAAGAGIPEPSALGLLAAGALGLAGYRGRRA